MGKAMSNHQELPVQHLYLVYPEECESVNDNIEIVPVDIHAGDGYFYAAVAIIGVVLAAELYALARSVGLV